jgi:hypothetical protein
MEVGEVYRDGEGFLWHVALDPTLSTPTYMVVAMGDYDLMAYRIESGGLQEAIGDHKLYRKANGQLIVPEPNRGELWLDVEGDKFFITAGRKAVCAQGATHQLYSLELVEKVWPRDDS